jgi:hypothetical protein
VRGGFRLLTAEFLWLEVTDPDSGALFIPNITPDFGLSAPFNLMFTFFGQFFDHGLDLVTKGGGTVKIPLRDDDPLFVANSPNAMFVTRGDRFRNSHRPSRVAEHHDAVGRPEPDLHVAIRPIRCSCGEYQDGRGEARADRPGARRRPLRAARGTGIPGDNICNIGNWADVKNQARTMLGISAGRHGHLRRAESLVTDPYGHFKPGPNGFPQMMLVGGGTLEGNPAATAARVCPFPPTWFTPAMRS